MFELLRIRDFGALWLAGLISFAGDAAIIFALPLHIYRLTNSTLATAGVLAATFLPRVLFGSVAGVFVDQWDRKWTMVAADTTRALFLLPILIAPDQLTVLYAVAAIQGTIGMFFRPAEGALLPKLVGEEHLVAANALNSLNNNIGMLVGPAMGTILYAAFGIGGTILADAATFAISAALISSIRADSRPERDSNTPIGGAAWERMASNWRAGITVVRRNPALRVLFLTSTLTGVAEGVFLTLGLSPLVLDVLGGTPAQVGIVGSAQAIGGLIAGVIVVRIGHKLTRRWLLGGGMIGIGLADFCTANVRVVAAAGTQAVGAAMGFMIAAGRHRSRL
ncbi:MAG: MFS transporter [Thermomicrobiales bacterium]